MVTNPLARVVGAGPFKFANLDEAANFTLCVAPFSPLAAFQPFSRYMYVSLICLIAASNEYTVKTR